MKFSERQGIIKVDNIIQVNEMNEDLRLGIWNVVYTQLYHFGIDQSPKYDQDIDRLIYSIWFDIFKKPVDEINTNIFENFNLIKSFILKEDWYKVYDLLEFIIQFNNSFFIPSTHLNTILQRENSAYRAIDNLLVPITDPIETQNIQNVIDKTEKLSLNSVNTHIKSALSLLSNKTDPDYRNSIKESISAVESIAQIISGKKNASLGKALDKLKEKIKIHRSLEVSLDSLYGYTCNGDGIRHALLDENNLDYEDAIFMLVSCSSFIHYLIIKAEKAGINLN